MIFPRFVYTDDGSVAVDFTLTLACRPFTSPARSIGGREESASGAVASWTVREDSKLRLPLRITESEWPAVLKMIRHGSRGTAITVHLGAESRSCRLLSPNVFEEDVEAQHAQYPGDMDLTTLWRSLGADWSTVPAHG